MCYLKVFVEILGLGEWAPPFFYSASATPLGFMGCVNAGCWCWHHGKPSKHRALQAVGVWLLCLELTDRPDGLLILQARAASLICFCVYT
jgi:hypothetical protein